MPLAFLGALLLLLFLLPRWRQAVGRRPKEEQISMNSGEYQAFSCTPLSLFMSGNTTKGIQQQTSLHSHLILGTDLFLFLFRSDFLFFFFPLGRGESSSSKEGLQAETEQKGHLLLYSFWWWEMKCEISAARIQQSEEHIFGPWQLLNPNIWTGIWFIYRVCVLRVSSPKLHKVIFSLTSISSHANSSCLVPV